MLAHCFEIVYCKKSKTFSQFFEKCGFQKAGFKKNGLERGRKPAIF